MVLKSSCLAVLLHLISHLKSHALVCFGCSARNVAVNKELSAVLVGRIEVLLILRLSERIVLFFMLLIVDSQTVSLVY